jgi:MFS family permease
MAEPTPDEQPRPAEPDSPSRPVEPASRAGWMGRALRRVAVDVSPLRSSRDFRLLWFGSIVSEAGHQVTHVAIYVQVFQLTRSAAAVGLVGLVELVPLTLASVAGGSVVDAVDRRKLLLLTQVGFAASSTLLLVTSLADRPPVALVYLGAGLGAGIGGISSPTRAAMVPRLVGREQLSGAIALNQVMWNATMIAGPAVGGVVIGGLGLPWAYGIDVITYGATIAAALMMRPMPPLAQEAEQASGLRAIREGYAYLRGRRVLQSTFVIDLIAMIFGMPRALFPVLAATQLHRGPEVIGVLFSALAVGALAGALTAGWVGRIRHQGRAVIWAVAAWGAGIIGFGLSGSNLALAVTFLALAGGADVISAVFRSAILQLSVPDRLRGRLSGIHILVVTGGPRLGDVEAGFLAQAFTPAVSVVSGGVACLAGVAVLALLVPQLWRYHAGSPA